MTCGLKNTACMAVFFMLMPLGSPSFIMSNTKIQIHTPSIQSSQSSNFCFVANEQQNTDEYS